MNLVKKSMRRDEITEILEKEYIVKELNTKEFVGTVSLMKILKVQNPFVIHHESHSFTILNDNYYWLQLAPRNDNWWLTIMYDENHNMIENYFDITKENDFTDPLNPTFIDMRLDVTISKERGVKLLDEDELEEALQDKLISEYEYKLAYEVSNQIIQKYLENPEAYYAVIQTLFQQFNR